VERPQRSEDERRLTATSGDAQCWDDCLAVRAGRERNAVLIQRGAQQLLAREQLRGW
jgi:hypothetical protein